MIDWLACLAVRLMSRLLCVMPAEAAVWCGQRLGGLIFWLQPKRCRVGIRNVRAAFDGRITPEASRRIIHAYCRHLGASAVELLRLPVIDRRYVERYITIEGYQHFEAAISSGRPIVLLTGHYGNWELCSIVAALRGYPIMALARAQKRLPRLYRLLVSYRESKGCTIIHKGGAMKRMIEALSRRQLIGIVGDQVSRQGLFVEFFGRPALFATGPFALAHQKRALILPAFIHRIRGPHHRIVVEPPIALPTPASEDEAARQGAQAFASVLARHIEQDPTQWLWLHKKWKYTPARRALVFSDGKLGHLKQSHAVVHALQEQHPQLVSQTVEIRYRSRLARGIALLWGWGMPKGWGGARCLRWTLTPESWKALRGRYADLIISCGASLSAPNVLWAAEHQAKSVVLMNPSPLPLSRFDVVISPRHDRLPHRRNVVQVDGAVAATLGEDALACARAHVQHHPRFRAGSGAFHGPGIAVFLGGDTAHYAVSEPFVASLMEGVARASRQREATMLVTTSRRTSRAVDAMLTQRFSEDPRCRLLLLASRDALNGTMEGMLGAADVAIVTGESISMVSEACASGRPVIVVEPPLRSTVCRRRTKHRRFLQDLAADGYVRIVPVHQVAAAIEQALSEPASFKRLDTASAVRHALQKLI